MIGARSANRLLAAPPGVQLAGAEALPRLGVQLPDGIQAGAPAADEVIEQFGLASGMLDVADALHRMRIPRKLAAYFCLPAFRAGELGLTGQQLSGEPLAADARVVAAAGSHPMGFSWSLFLGQRLT